MQLHDDLINRKTYLEVKEEAEDIYKKILEAKIPQAEGLANNNI